MNIIPLIFMALITFGAGFFFGFITGVFKERRNNSIVDTETINAEVDTIIEKYRK